jgi:hypothetical protein
MTFKVPRFPFLAGSVLLGTNIYNQDLPGTSFAVLIVLKEREKCSGAASNTHLGNQSATTCKAPTRCQLDPVGETLTNDN